MAFVFKEAVNILKEQFCPAPNKGIKIRQFPLVPAAKVSFPIRFLRLHRILLNHCTKCLNRIIEDSSFSIISILHGNLKINSQVPRNYFHLLKPISDEIWRSLTIREFLVYYH